MDVVDQGAHNVSREDAKINYSSVETLDFWPHQVILICLYSLIAIVSFTLNSLTIVILVRCDKIYTELYVYLINLSASDIVMSLLCIPFTFSSFILNRWVFPHIMCPFVNFVQICSVLVNIWTLTLIGIERYIAILKPMESMPNNNDQSKCGRNNKRLFCIALIWLVAVCSGWVQLVFTRVVPVQHQNRTVLDCQENIPEHYSKIYTCYLFVSAFVLPLLILVYVYTVIGYHVWRHVPPTNSSDHDNRKKVVKMLLLVVCLFFLCWFPLQIFTLLVAFVDNFLQIHSDRDFNLLVYGYLVAHILAMSHSFLNPIVYCFFSAKFSLYLCAHLGPYCQRITNFCYTTKPPINRQQTNVRIRGARCQHTLRQTLAGEPV